MKKVLITLIFIFCYKTVYCQTFLDSVYSFQKINDSLFTYEDNHDLYKLSSKGLLEINDISINLNIEYNCWITKSYICPKEDSLYVFYTYRDEEGAMSEITLIQKDKQSLKLNWRLDVQGFNLSCPLVTNNSIFIATNNLIGSINPVSGLYNWKVYLNSQKYNKLYISYFYEMELECDKLRIYYNSYKLNSKNILLFNAHDGVLLAP